MKRKFNIGTTITAVSLAVILSIFISGLFRNDLINTFRYISMPILIVVFTLWSTKMPKALELTAYGIAIFLLFQGIWDWYAMDWNNLRTEIVVPCIISLIINSVSGKVRLIGAKKTLKNQLGLGR